MFYFNTRKEFRNILCFNSIKTIIRNTLYLQITYSDYSIRQMVIEFFIMTKHIDSIEEVVLKQTTEIIIENLILTTTIT